VKRITHEGITVKVSRLPDDELAFVKQAIDMSVQLQPDIVDHIKTIDYTRVDYAHAHIDPLQLEFFRYVASHGRYTYRQRLRDEPGTIKVNAGPCMEDSIGVLCHELTHARMRAEGNEPIRKQGQRAQVHTIEFFNKCAELYRLMGCTEVAPLHDMLVYKSSEAITRRNFPEHRDWHLRMLTLRRTQMWDKLVHELRALAGPLD